MLLCPVGASLVVWVIVARRNRVNANETWWKASPRVAKPKHTSSEYCTINHLMSMPQCSSSQLSNLCNPSHKTWIRKKGGHGRMSQGKYTHGDSQRCQKSRPGEGKCFVLSVSLSILRYYWGAQIYSIKLGLLRGQSDCCNTELSLFNSNQVVSCPKSKEIMFD